VITSKYTTIDGASHPFEEVVILVNGKVRPTASNLVNGDSLYVIFRSMGLDANSINAPRQCNELRSLTYDRGGCGRINSICNTPAVTTSLSYFFLPVTLCDIGMHLTITTTTTNFSSSVIMNGEPLAHIMNHNSGS